MSRLIFELGRLEHAKAIQEMRQASSDFLTQKLGLGHWTATSRLPSIKERLGLGDPVNLSRNTIFVASQNGEPVASVVVSTFPPGFWKRSYWAEPSAKGLGVFNLVVLPELQGMGLGRFVMDGVEGLAMNIECPAVRLDAYAANPYSNGFYRHIGYQERATFDLRGVGLVLYEKVLAIPEQVRK